MAKPPRDPRGDHFSLREGPGRTGAHPGLPTATSVALAHAVTAQQVHTCGCECRASLNLWIDRSTKRALWIRNFPPK